MTILGQHTVHELDDLVKAHNYHVDQLTKASANCSAWKQRDPQGYAAWSTDFTQAAANWAHVSHVAMNRIDLTPQSMRDYVPLESDYQAVLTAFHPFDDLTLRFTRDSQCSVDMSATPQPQAPDADLQAYQTADAATKWIDKKAKDAATGTMKVVPIVLGGVGVALTALLLARRAVSRVVTRAIEGES